MDYLHYNPVKHGLVSQVKEWPFSSFHQQVERGVLDANWGVEHEQNFVFPNSIE